MHTLIGSGVGTFVQAAVKFGPSPRPKPQVNAWFTELVPGSKKPFQYGRIRTIFY